MFRKRYADVFTGDRAWRRTATVKGLTYAWDAKSTYVRHPPYFAGLPKRPAPVGDIAGAPPLPLLPRHSPPPAPLPPAGASERDGPAGRYLIEHGVEAADFNSYGARRGNHEVMMR